MADQEKDKSQQTEEPTEKRKKEAREEGQIAISKELMAWGVLLGGAIVLVGLGPSLVVHLKLLLIPFIQKPEEFILNGGHAPFLVKKILIFLIGVLAVPFVIYITAALLSGFLQTSFNFSLKKLQPKLEKLSPIKGLGRLFSSQSVVELLKSCFKIVVIGTIVYHLLKPLVFGVEGIQQLSVDRLLPLMHRHVFTLFLWVLGIVAAIVIVDYLYQKFKTLKELRMTKQEVKEEFRQTEGDPHIKQKLKQIRSKRAQERMMAKVSEATAVVTNPTHYAVALQYDFEGEGAPVVVAKGADHLALKIREIAGAHDIEIIENPPLARALYDTVELDQEIPETHYKAVAEIIRLVMRKKRIKLQ